MPSFSTKEQNQETQFMLVKAIAKVAIGAGLLGMLLTCGARADEKKGLPGPIDNLGDLQETGKMLFKLIDTNNDNRISQKEAVDAGNLLAGGFFFRADANGDGTVTQEEARAAREALFNQRPLLRFVFERTREETQRQGTQPQLDQAKQTVMNVLDSNHDGNISAAELRQAVQSSVQTIFMMADKNGDGQLDPAELNAAVADAGRTAVQTAFNAADTDKNGAVSQAEFDKAIINPAHVLFRIFDANNDNQISPDEMRSGMQILAREVRSLRVPEPPNSISNQIRRQNAAQAPIGSPAPAPAPVVAPGTATIPPR
jgi:Ca2+-binding EF-hand superfamily protein